MHLHIRLHLLLLLCGTAAAAAPREKSFSLSSPDGKISAAILCGDNLRYCVTADGDTILRPEQLSLALDDGTVWGRMPRVTKAVRSSSDKIIPSPFYKRAEVRDRFNQLSLSFAGGYALDLRAYDDGVAYRWRKLSGKPARVADEKAAFRFPDDTEAFVPYVRNRSGKPMTFTQQFANSFENVYTHDRISKLDPARLIFLPIVAELPSGHRICITEADLESYPGMYLNNPDGGNTLRGVFAPYPKTTEIGGHNGLQHMVTAAEDYIARTDGARTFPWRAVIVARHDAELLDSDMTYKLASPSRIDDTSWIRPGKVAWEWWNDWGVYGVDFKSGINTETYKHYIDFAAEHGIEYVILDEGWSVHGKCDLLQVVPEIDLPRIVEYGRAKNVGIILWAGYAALDKDVEGLCEHYARMGIKGFKVDFMNRDDQPLVDFVYRIAEAAARHRLLLDLHGMYKPTGLNRTYPNIVNFEGVHGLETVKWTPIDVADQVVYDVTVPFIRMVAGPMDYTQGAMLNGTRETFRVRNSLPMSPGTRCRQLAEYVIFESPLNMMCDSPNNYRKEPECTRFIASVPTVWSQTLPLDGKIGQFAAIARRKGDSWWIGALTDWNPRSVDIDLSPLNLHPGQYRITIFRDGPNADRYPNDFSVDSLPLPKNNILNLQLAPGGGAAIRIDPLTK